MTNTHTQAHTLFSKWQVVESLASAQTGSLCRLPGWTARPGHSKDPLGHLPGWTARPGHSKDPLRHLPGWTARSSLSKDPLRHLPGWTARPCHSKDPLRHLPVWTARSSLRTHCVISPGGQHAPVTLRPHTWAVDRLGGAGRT